jgi:hypothetical protein
MCSDCILTTSAYRACNLCVEKNPSLKVLSAEQVKAFRTKTLLKRRFMDEESSNWLTRRLAKHKVNDRRCLIILLIVTVLSCFYFIMNVIRYLLAWHACGE